MSKKSLTRIADNAFVSLIGGTAVAFFAVLWSQ